MCILSTNRAVRPQYPGAVFCVFVCDHVIYCYRRDCRVVHVECHTLTAGARGRYSRRGGGRGAGLPRVTPRGRPGRRPAGAPACSWCGGRGSRSGVGVAVRLARGALKTLCKL